LTITPEMLQAQRAALTPRGLPRPASAPATVPRAPALTPGGNAKLGPAAPDGPGDYILFDFNPASILIAHTAPVQTSAGIRPTGRKPADSAAAQSRARGQVALSANGVDELERAKGTTSITLRSLTFDGPGVASVCLRLLDWSHFQPVDDPTDPKKSKLPELKFVWGPQIYLVTLNQVAVAYTRFSSAGKPVRATVDLTLHSIPKVPGPTNPSSGGLPGRRTHLLTGAESLPELATRCYGGPGRWREIAAANRFEDPLRVRPGTLVYLPSAQEDAP
jgi:nucleoid-associated protein YgaU